MDDQIIERTTKEDFDKFVADAEAEIQAAQSHFIALDEEKEQHKKFFENYSAAIENLVRLTGTEHFFQDEKGIVYKTDDCKGKFVYFDRYEIKRTRREGEEKGSLSMKEAREAGFLVEGK